MILRCPKCGKLYDTGITGRGTCMNCKLNKRVAMDIEHAKKMLGTEFVYHFEDGDTIKAYVKAFDPEIGLTCYSLEMFTDEGWSPDSDTEKELDGTYCVMAHSFKNGWHSLAEALEALQEIEDTGHYIGQGSSGSVHCAFM